MLIGKNCVGEIKQMVAMGEEKRRALGCVAVRVSRVKEGWQVAGWVTLSQQEIGVA